MSCVVNAEKMVSTCGGRWGVKNGGQVTPLMPVQVPEDRLLCGLAAAPTGEYPTARARTLAGMRLKGRPPSTTQLAPFAKGLLLFRAFPALAAQSLKTFLSLKVFRSASSVQKGRVRLGEGLHAVGLEVSGQGFDCRSTA